MKFEFRAFGDMEELKAWFDGVCIRCAMCNEGGKRRCDKCRANRIYKNTAKEDFGVDVTDEDDQ